MTARHLHASFAACLFFLLLLCTMSVRAAVSVSDTLPAKARLTRQVHFPKYLTPGNYSGIAYLGYLGTCAVVSDKPPKGEFIVTEDDHRIVEVHPQFPQDGYLQIEIFVDRLDGEIKFVAPECYQYSSDGPRDAEGICYLLQRNTLLIVGEGDNKIKEYYPHGPQTGRELSLEPADGNRGYESLTFCDSTCLLWTCTEGALPRDRDSLQTDELIRLQAFDEDFHPQGEYAYLTDKPRKRASRMRNYAFGVSELCALNDGSLLVLEREFAVPRLKIGASVRNKIYRVWPQRHLQITGEDASSARAKALKKTLVAQWKTRLTLFSRSLANYEGMCLGPTLTDGTQVVILVADSQNNAGGVLRDYFRTLLLPKSF